MAEAAGPPAGSLPEASAGFPTAQPIRAVIFDFHSTLYDGGDPRDWVDIAWRACGREGDPAELDGYDGLVAWLDRVWDHAAVIDPEAKRDLSPQWHREVYDATAVTAPVLAGDPELAAATYTAIIDAWHPYADVVPVLTELRRREIPIAVLSNIGVDIRPSMRAHGVAELVDAIVLSYEVGAVKPDPAIFREAVRQLGSDPAATLMVGDGWSSDGGAAQLGIRTLILPRTSGPQHGLDAVLRLVG